jgi:hypothetical protein
MTPLAISPRMGKTADRVGGITLMIPWPSDLPRGDPVPRDGERPTTEAEHAAAEAMLSSACREHHIVLTRSAVVNAAPPVKGLWRDRGTHRQVLAVRLIGRRWVHAAALYREPRVAPHPEECHWHPSGELADP